MYRIVLVAILILAVFSPVALRAKDNKSEDNARDLRNLTEHLQQQGKTVGWMKVNLKANLNELLEAPYILIRGFKAPKLHRSSKKTVKKYLVYGGALFGMARIAKKHGNMFEKPFVELASELCPNIKMKKLPSTHPVYSIKHKIPTKYQCLRAIEDDCRIVVLYSRKNLFRGYKSRRGKKEELSDGMKLMENVSEYIAQCGALREKLDHVYTVSLAHPRDVRSGMMVIPHVVRKADENRVHTMALPMLLEELWRRDKIRTASADKAIIFKDLDPKTYPLVYLNAKKWEYSEEEEKALEKYIRSGGRVFAEALGGSEEFDKGIRKMLSALFAKDTFKPARRNHYLMKAVNRAWILKATPELLKKNGGKRKFREPVFEILEIDEKPVMVYSKYDLACGWSDYPCFKRLGYSKKNALKMARKIVKFLLGKEKK